jgi:D-sedoheptulose 7-phosphate isomerase
MDKLRNRFDELGVLISKFYEHAQVPIDKAIKQICETFQENGRILICGNGGSAADSQHFAAEFVNAFSREIDRRALPAQALSTDTSVITAISNDFGYEHIFSRQVEAFGRPGDTLIALTTSGTSVNCIEALKKARELHMSSIVFTRRDSMASLLADISIEVPSENTQHIQECHLLAYHVITELVEDKLFRQAED